MEITCHRSDTVQLLQGFKIDGIVWKFYSLIRHLRGLQGFKIDGIVWKYTKNPKMVYSPYLL